MRKISPFDLAQKILYLDGKPFDLSERQYLKPLHNSPHKRSVYKFGRQCEKSTTLASKMASFGTVIPAFKNLYVSPTSKQSRVFSTVRLKEFLRSPFIRKNFIDKTCIQAVFHKSLKNYAQYFIEYCFLTADRVRGISADWIFIDEVQDIVTDFIPVIEEAASHSKYKLFTYAGTPKTPDNTIEYYWEQSTQREIALKCQHCGFWNVGLGMANISETGLICAKCKRSLTKERWEWVRAVSLKDCPYEGFHLNQLNVPWTEWDEILVKLKLYSTEKFHNEVLGLSYDSGTKPITQQELMACCVDDRQMANGNEQYSSPLFAGVDWGLTADISYTVLVIGEYLPWPDKFKLHYAKLYGQEMSDPRTQVQDIIKICKRFGVATIGADWGAGSVQNLSLADAFGVGRVVQFYHTGNQQERIKYNKKRWIYTTNRTFVMADLFNDFIKRKIECFNWNQFKDFAHHILAVYSDIRKHQQKETLYYDHRIDRPDDAFHAILFAKLAGDIFYQGRPV
jgi:hypothetical protein